MVSWQVIQEQENFMTTAVAIVGGLMAVLQGFMLFTLSDLRERIMRLENREMKPAQVGD